MECMDHDALMHDPYVKFIGTERCLYRDAHGQKQDRMEERVVLYPLRSTDVATNLRKIESARSRGSRRVAGFGNFPRNEAFDRLAAEIQKRYHSDMKLVAMEESERTGRAKKASKGVGDEKRLPAPSEAGGDAA